jgi:CheY-like chemotaxis protein
MSIRVLIADDQVMVRAGFRMILEMQNDMEVVGETSDGVETITAVKKVKPDIIMLSMSLMGRKGPQRDYTGFAPTVHAFSGLTGLTASVTVGPTNTSPTERTCGGMRKPM